MRHNTEVDNWLEKHRSAVKGKKVVVNLSTLPLRTHNRLLFSICYFYSGEKKGEQRKEKKENGEEQECVCVCVCVCAYACLVVFLRSGM